MAHLIGSIETLIIAYSKTIDTYPCLEGGLETTSLTLTSSELSWEIIYSYFAMNIAPALVADMALNLQHSLTHIFLRLYSTRRFLLL